jgi:hypothetical protein
VERPPLEDFARRVRGLSSNDELDAAASEVITAFDAIGVRYLLLKGPALARLLYTRGEHRGYADIDLLVAPGDLEAAGRAVSQLGYTNVTERWGVEDVAGAVHADMWVRRNQRIGPLMLDLHTRLAGAEAAPEVAWEALEARKTWIDMDGCRVAVLRPDGLALHVATHAAQHGPEMSKPIADLTYGLERWPLDVWQDAAQLASEVDALEAFAVGLRLVPSGATLASDLELPSADQVEWAMLHRDARPRGTFHLRALTEATTLAERVRAVQRALVPSRAWILFQYPSAHRGRPWLIAARAHHLLRTPVWAVRALRYRRQARRASR